VRVQGQRPFSSVILESLRALRDPFSCFASTKPWLIGKQRKDQPWPANSWMVGLRRP